MIDELKEFEDHNLGLGPKVRYGQLLLCSDAM